MRCYLCSAETSDAPMLSGVVVCLACRNREGVYLDVTPPEMRAQNESFIRLFGEPHTMQLRHVWSEHDVVGEWKRLCDEILARDAIAKKFVRGDFGPLRTPARIVGETLTHAESDASPVELPATKLSDTHPKRLEMSFPAPLTVEYLRSAGYQEEHLAAWAALLGIPGLKDQS